jgi:hypothetical protein
MIMNEIFIEKIKSPVSDETRRKIAFERLGKKHTVESLAKMKGAPLHKNYPPKCNKCNSRDANMCARHNMECFTARGDERGDNICVKRHMKRKEHPDYIKKGVRHV